MLRSCLRLIAAISALSPSFVLAQTPTPAPRRGCDSEQQRQFDFWIGDWDVTVGGQQAGHNRIERILEGCALLENWAGAGGMSGKSLNFYKTLNRITWTPLPAGQVRQVWETSSDGKSWTVAFDGLYTRKR